MPPSESLVPESERWIHEPEAASRLDHALAAMNQPPKEVNLDELEEQLHKLT